MRTTNFYVLLQITKDASTETIKSAYRKRVFELHPDRSDYFNKEEFLLIQKAYNTLTDPDKRAVYDKILERQNKAREQVKKRYAQENQSQKKPHSQKESLSHSSIVFLSLEQLLKGCVTSLFFRDKRINIKIPPKSYPGRRIVFLTDYRGEPLQVIATLQRKPGREKLVKDNGDIYCDLTIDSNTAALGGRENITTPAGETVEVSLNGGHRHGQIIRLRNAGLHRKDGARGDLYITLAIKKVFFNLRAVFSN